MLDFNQNLNNEWSNLLLATKTAKHPFHQFTLSNSLDNQPHTRTIILRNVIKQHRIIGFNTDKRSPKYSALLINNNVAALFYDTNRKIQLRINGHIKLNNDIQKRKMWDSLALESKLCYMGPYAPSSIIKHYRPNIPLKKITEIPKSEYELGYVNFINFHIKVNSIDWLYLHSGGHKRIKYEWINDKLTTNWIAT